MINASELPGLTRLWLRQADVPMQNRGWGFDDTDLTGYSPKIVALLQDWSYRISKGRIIRRTGKGLLLQGPPGQGKTTLASVLLNEIIVRTQQSVFQTKPTEGLPMRPVYYTTYPGLLRLQRRLMNLDDGDEWLRLTQVAEGVFGEHQHPEWNVSVLVLDDVGKEHTTRSHWAEDSFDEILRARFDRGLPTIITSNTPVQDWAEAYGESMASFIHQAFDLIPLVNRNGDQRASA